MEVFLRKRWRDTKIYGSEEKLTKWGQYSLISLTFIVNFASLDKGGVPKRKFQFV